MTSRGARSLLLAAILVAMDAAGVRAQTAPPPASPPPGYPPPGYYPPPGSYPPPGYYAPPAFPQPDYVRPPPRPAKRFFQLIPYVGVHSFQGDGGAILRPGVRVGGLLGLRVNEYLTINGELTIDALNPSNLPMRGLFESYSEQQATIGLSPLVAFPASDNIELAFGPKLAFWGADYSQVSMTRGLGTGTYSGYDLGANAALFAHVARTIWVGGLAAFDVRIYGNSCFTPLNGLERCNGNNLPSADRVIALSVLLMFSP